MGCYQVTLDIAGISIALAIHSLDPLECRRKEESCSIDISQDLLSRSLYSRLILWSENQTTKERLFEASHRAKTSVTCQANRSGRNSRMSP